MSIIKVEVIGAVNSVPYDMTDRGGSKGVSHSQAARFSWGRGENASSVVSKLKLTDPAQAYANGVYFVAPEAVKFTGGMPQIENKPLLMTEQETLEYLRSLVEEIEMR